MVLKNKVNFYTNFKQLMLTLKKNNLSNMLIKNPNSTSLYENISFILIDKIDRKMLPSFVYSNPDFIEKNYSNRK